MADLIHIPSKFDEIYIHSLAYKVVLGHEILLSIVTPKALATKGANSQPKWPLFIFTAVFSLLEADYFLPGFPIGLCEKKSATPSLINPSPN
jgi:hypothetical protein